MKVLANDGISKVGEQKLLENGFEVITEKVSQGDLIDAINEHNYEVLLVRSATKVRQDIIDACPGLKFIGRGGVGMDNIDVEYARNKGIVVENTPSSSSLSVAELVMAHLFAAMRFLNEAAREMPEKGVNEFKVLKKKYAKGAELRGKTIGIIGFGRIGQALAQYALGCGMKVIATDHHCEGTKIIDFNIEGLGTLKVGIPIYDMEELIQKADIISLHIPKQKNGEAVLGKRELEILKKHAILINSARGGVIDEKALIQALDNEQLKYAILDVFENEPNPMSELLTHPKIFTSPHIGAATVEAQSRIGLELADKIIENCKIQIQS